MGTRRVLWLTLYAVAFGFLEASVVVYLRELYYPEGFHFPLVLLPDRIAIIEMVRELTTMIMLLAVAVLAGSDRVERFFAFGYLFGVWDVTYYIGLRAFVGWPASLFTWDVLFLIPVPWLGPVLYPVFVSVLLIVGFLTHETLRRRNRALRPVRREWVVASVGAILVVISFCWNWRTVQQGTVPTSFPVVLFAVGLLAGALPFVRAAYRATTTRT